MKFVPGREGRPRKRPAQLIRWPSIQFRGGRRVIACRFQPNGRTRERERERLCSFIRTETSLSIASLHWYCVSAGSYVTCFLLPCPCSFFFFFFGTLKEEGTACETDAFDPLKIDPLCSFILSFFLGTISHQIKYAIILQNVFFFSSFKWPFFFDVVCLGLFFLFVNNVELTGW